MKLIEIKLPEELMETLPSDREQLKQRLSEHFDKVIAEYESNFVQQVAGLLGGRLSRFEKANLKDFLMRTVLPDLESSQMKEVKKINAVF